MLTAFVSACAVLKPAAPEVEDSFGHRVEGQTEDGRTTIAITPARDGVEYRLFDASYDNVTYSSGRSNCRPTELVALRLKS